MGLEHAIGALPGGSGPPTCVLACTWMQRADTATPPRSQAICVGIPLLLVVCCTLMLWCRHRCGLSMGTGETIPNVAPHGSRTAFSDSLTYAMAWPEDEEAAVPRHSSWAMPDSPVPYAYGFGSGLHIGAGLGFAASATAMRRVASAPNPRRASTNSAQGSSRALRRGIVRVLRLRRTPEVGENEDEEGGAAGDGAGQEQQQPEAGEAESQVPDAYIQGSRSQPARLRSLPASRVQAASRGASRLFRFTEWSQVLDYVSVLQVRQEQ